MPISRRDFLTTTTATAAALGLTGAGLAFANETSDIRVAQIGFHGQGKHHIRALGNRVVALCDVDRKVLARQAQKLKESLGRSVETYTDFRKLLENPNIDAVSIATPNHTHALITIAAAQAGKHVYVEKPVSHNIWEGRQMVAAAKKYDRIIQCGTQSRSSPALVKAVEFVQSGSLGKIEYALGTCYKPRKPIGKSKTPLEFPSHVDRSLWMGPAEDKPIYLPKKNSTGSYNPHYDWHWDFNTGNGDMGNQGIHQVDIARWFLGEDALAPRTISIGGRLGYEDAGDTPNTQIAYFDYPNAPLIFETRGLPRSLAGQKNWGRSMDRYRGSRIGVIVQCEKGYVLIPSYVEAIVYDNHGERIQQWKEGGRHHDNWLAAIAAGDASKLNVQLVDGHLSSALCHLGGISHQLGKKTSAEAIGEHIRGNERLSISFDRMASHLRANGVNIDGKEPKLTLGASLELDPATERFTNNDDANRLHGRETQRTPFAVPNVEAELTTAATG